MLALVSKIDPETGERVKVLEEVPDGDTPPALSPEEARAQMPPLTPRQLRLGLVGSGIALSAVDAAIDAISDPTQRDLARIEWNWANQFERLNPLLVSISTALGLTDEQIDTLWTTAKDL